MGAKFRDGICHTQKNYKLFIKVCISFLALVYFCSVAALDIGIRWG
jgi:hypothetical protein